MFRVSVSAVGNLERLEEAIKGQHRASTAPDCRYTWETTAQIRAQVWDEITTVKKTVERRPL